MAGFRGGVFGAVGESGGEFSDFAHVLDLPISLFESLEVGDGELVDELDLVVIGDIRFGEVDGDGCLELGCREEAKGGLKASG